MKRFRFLFIISFVCLFGACSSVDSDAKKAVSLMDKSMEATLEYDFEEAGKYFRQYKEIENKYKNTPEQGKFEEAYWKYKQEKQG